MNNWVAAGVDSRKLNILVPFYGCADKLMNPNANGLDEQIADKKAFTQNMANI